MEAGVPLELWDNVNGDKSTNMFAAIRWQYDRPARVIRQYACTGNVHPEEPRCFTFREVARIMGLPDVWSVCAAIDNRAKGQLWFGKGIPVESGQWIANWAAESLNGRPGPIDGVPIGEREHLIDVRKPRLSMYANMDRLFEP
jgi:site-specific DNA-cytosine methylase